MVRQKPYRRAPDYGNCGNRIADRNAAAGDDLGMDSAFGSNIITLNFRVMAASGSPTMLLHLNRYRGPGDR